MAFTIACATIQAVIWTVYSKHQ